MSIQKITKSELLSMGVQSLPNRPSSPSLYSGRTLSATELKAAFDRLPTLIAERFNALLDATGLYTNEGTYERLAELIATDIEEAPSLAAFFEDVKNGNLALYLSADGEASLSAVIEELRRAILHLQSTSFLMEGDGDIVSGISVEEPFITLHKDIKSDDIVAKANRYTDAPRGAVEEGCTLPVSGGRVARAIAEVDAKTDHSLGVRVEALEKAAQGVLYSYPVQDATGERIFVTKEALPYSAVCRLGGTLPSSRNLLSEHILTTYRSDTLRIDWDAENACLVFNGTLTPEEGEVRLAVFRADATPIDFVGGIFYRGGNLCGAGAVSLSFRTQDGASFSLPFLEADSTSTSLYLETNDENFDAICMSTTEPVVFDGYRCNICLENWDIHAEVVYTPRDPKSGRRVPAAITSVGPNLFTGERRYRGKGAVTIEVNCPARNCQLVISYHAVSASQRPNLPFRITCSGGSSSVASKPYGSRQAYSFFSSDYVKSITFTDTSTDENGDPYEIEIRDFQIEQVEPKVKTARPYSEPYTYTLSLPASLSRFDAEYYGLGDARCNYLDLEQGAFVRSVKALIIDGSLDFVEDSTAPCRYYAPLTVPEGILSGAFYPTSIFKALPDNFTTEEGCIWFLEGIVVLQSELFPTLEILKDFLTHHPVEVLYASDPSLELLTAAESEALISPLLRASAGSRISFAAADGTSVPSFLRMQYQVKNEAEVSA